MSNRSSFFTLLRTSLFVLLMLSGVASFGAERVLVVGDSITGHSMNLPYGYAHEVRKALAAANNDMEFVPLGGSGQTIFSWRNIIKGSYENNHRLDIADIFVKDEFDRGADTIIVHLGMNDALQPSIKSDEEGFKAWREEYVSLVSDLRKRVPSVKRIILTPPTMLTENPCDFKNLFMDRFASIIKEVAAENGCEYFDLRAEFERHFLAARRLNPDFRMTLDFVHPNEFGHQIMTWSFLRSLGLDDIAATYYETKVAAEIKDFSTPGVSLFVNDVLLAESPAKADASRVVPVEIKGFLLGLNPADVKISSDVLTVKSIESANESEFTAILEGPTSALPTTISVEIADVKKEVLVNAPYFVATGFPFDSYPRPEEFPREKASTAVDAAALAGSDPLDVALPNPVDANAALQWYCYYPTLDKTGATNPNAVDIAALAPANAFDAGYVVRYIVSPKAQKATLKLNSEGFSTTAIETIYLNGSEIYFDCLSPRHIKAVDQVEVELKEGLNILVSRVDHTNWQWATSYSFEDAEGLSF